MCLLHFICLLQPADSPAVSRSRSPGSQDTAATPPCGLNGSLGRDWLCSEPRLASQQSVAHPEWRRRAVGLFLRHLPQPWTALSTRGSLPHRGFAQLLGMEKEAGSHLPSWSHLWALQRAWMQFLTSLLVALRHTGQYGLHVRFAYSLCSERLCPLNSRLWGSHQECQESGPASAHKAQLVHM